jgi:deoxycytidylate deaminase
MSLDLAIKAALANPIKRAPRMAAVIKDRKRLVSIGLNTFKTHPLQAKFGKMDECIYLHAEIAAFVNARCDVTGMTLYVARVTRDGKPALAKPCSGCQRAIVQFGFGKVEWTT